MKKKNLLIDEYPLLVLPSLAAMIGLNEAIALQQVHYWLENPKGGVEIEGERWVYNTYEEWQMDNFPFWSVRTVQRVFNSLEEMGLVLSMQKAAYDRKKYYRVHYDKLASWNTSDCRNAEFQNGTLQDDNSAPSSLTETTETTGADAPKENWKIGDQELPVDWQVGLGKEITNLTEGELFKKQARDAANLIEQGCAGGGELAYAFMVARQIILPESKAKGQRKAAREMLEMKVKATHVVEATKQLMQAKDKKGNPLTCVDLFSISNVAIGLANQVDMDTIRPPKKHHKAQPKEGMDINEAIRLGIVPSGESS